MTETDYRDWERSQELKGRTVRRSGEITREEPIMVAEQDGVIDVGFTEILGVFERMAIIECCKSIENQFAEHGHAAVYDEEDISLTGLATAARQIVIGNLEAIDKSNTLRERREGATPERLRRTENITNWIQGFVVGHRYARVGAEVEKSGAAKRILDAMMGEAENEEVQPEQADDK